MALPQETSRLTDRERDQFDSLRDVADRMLACAQDLERRARELLKAVQAKYGHSGQ
jgi:hypothetical protein